MQFMVETDNCRETEVVFLIWVDWVMQFMVETDNCRETEVVLWYISHLGGLSDVIYGGTR
jgi:lipid-A-disaccharide synthase-like uncharacterized protein